MAGAAVRDAACQAGPVDDPGAAPKRRVLVIGGVRSGKSRHAEGLLSADEPVRYLAAGPTDAEDPDPDWAARLAAHRGRRPSRWTTVETVDLAGELAAARGPVLIDCLSTWLARLIDRTDGWQRPVEEIASLVTEQLTGLTAALDRATADVVVVTNEVGLGVVPEHRSGRVFRDLLGTVNAEVAGHCDEVHLVVAGRVLRL